MTVLNNFEARFLALHAQLQQHEQYWRSSPYREPQLSWLQTNPALADAAVGLDAQQLSLSEQSPQELNRWLSEFLPDLAPLLQAVEPPRAQTQAVTLPPHWHVGIGGRKRSQIEHFCQTFQPGQQHLIDWCSGKGYLGRTLAKAHNLSATGIEINPGLCHSGAQACATAGIDMRFLQADVLDPASLNPLVMQLPGNSHIVALHACGDLHRRLLRFSVEQDIAALNLVPCCYSLWLNHGGYEPLSALAQQNNLNLQRDHLNLAVQEVVTAKARETEQLHHINSWRLGFDELQRDVRQTDVYLETPSIPKSAVNWGFESVCQHLAQAVGLALPKEVNWDQYAGRGQARWQRTRRLQLVAQGFRRLLELWLVYDLVLFLQQSGYSLSLTTFCERQVTPRNLLINAVRP